ncbi:MAG: WD40 repeat domain-containing protein [Phycisphaerae bacterium]|nr:WD40 repeat domain-containing protein [Phycisphaerae bacterium]MCZ2401000.1 WD40 repeat domain-containing protein [Phycisphaerae bacterium]
MRARMIGLRSGMRGAGPALVIGIACCGLASAGGQQPLAKLQARAGQVADLSFSPDGRLLASGHDDDRVRIWSVNDRRIERTIRVRVPVLSGSPRPAETQQHIEAVSWSPGGEFVASGFSAGFGRGVVQLWEPATGKELRTLAENVHNVRVTAVSPDGRLVAVNLRDPEHEGQMIVLFDSQTGATAGRLRGERLAVTAALFLPDGRRLVSAGGTKAQVWDLENHALLCTFDKHKSAINCLAVAPDGALVATGDARDVLHLWNPEGAAGVHEIEMKYDLSRPPRGSRERMRGAGADDAKRPGGVTALVFSRSGRTVIAGYVDRGIRLWSTKTGKRWESLFGHAERVTALAITPDGGTLASGGRDGLIALWKLNEPATDPTVDEDDEGRTGDDGK